MKKYLKLFPILVIFLTINLILASTESSCVEARVLYNKCSTYCYKVVKPLIQDKNVGLVKEKTIAQLKKKLEEKNILINVQKEKIKAKEEQLALQLKLINAYETMKNTSILEKEHEVHRLISVVKDKDQIIGGFEQRLNNLTKAIQIKNEELASNGKLLSLCEDSMEESSYKETVLSWHESVIIEDENCKGSGNVSLVILSNSQTFLVPCASSDASRWIVIQRRFDGSLNFNRKWDDYKRGFGDLHGEFFIGLEKMHLLTESRPHKLLIELTDFQNNSYSARYSNFKIGNETESYILKSVGEFTGNTRDSLKKHVGFKFSTIDRDNDGNCANLYLSGWWFDWFDCFVCNLNGVYSNVDGRNRKRIAWNNGNFKAYKTTLMMIQPSA